MAQRLGRHHDDLGALLRRVRSSLLVRCLRRFAAIGGRDRLLVLAGQAFTTVVPLAIVVAAVAGRDSAAVGDRMVRRFHVTGDAASAVRTLFERPPDSTGAITVVGVVVLLASLLSLTRSLQRTYEAAWELPPRGMRGTLYGVGGMGVLVTQLLVLSLLASALRPVPAGSVLTVLLRVVLASLLWLILQDLLLARRVPRRQLVPGAVVAGVGQVLISIYSAVWMPRLIGSNAEQYGVIGVTFAMLTWLIVLAACLVAVAVISAEVGQPAHHEPAHTPG